MCMLTLCLNYQMTRGMHWCEQEAGMCSEALLLQSACVADKVDSTLECHDDVEGMDSQHRKTSSEATTEGEE